MMKPGSVVDADVLTNDAASSLRQRKKDATHLAIADAAWALFAEKGYEETSINDIAERANVAPRTFFRYFPTKEAVTYPELDESLEMVRAAFRARPSDEPVMVSLITAFESLTDSMSQDTQRNRTRLELVKQADSVAFGEYFRRKLIELVDALVVEREGNQPDVALRAKLAGGIIGLIMDTSRDHWVESGTTEALPDIGHRCMSMVLDLLSIPRD